MLKPIICTDRLTEEKEIGTKPFTVWIIRNGQKVQARTVWAEDQNRAKRYYRNFYALGFKSAKLGCKEAPEMDYRT